MKFRLLCWKRFAQKPEKLPPKLWNTNGKVFFQRRCFPWKRSCGHIECSSDRRVYKNLRKVRKKVGIIPIKNLESNEVLTTVLENSCRNPEKSPSKIRNIIWKLFFFSKNMLPMKTILWTHRVQFRQTSL